MRTKLYLMRARFQESFILTHLILSMYVLGGAICVLWTSECVIQLIELYVASLANLCHGDVMEEM